MNSQFQQIPTVQQPLLPLIPTLVDGEPVLPTIEEKIKSLVLEATMQHPDFATWHEDDRAIVLMKLAEKNELEFSKETLVLALGLSSQHMLPGFDVEL